MRQGHRGDVPQLPPRWQVSLAVSSWRFGWSSFLLLCASPAALSGWTSFLSGAEPRCSSCLGWAPLHVVSCLLPLRALRPTSCLPQGRREFACVTVRAATGSKKKRKCLTFNGCSPTESKALSIKAPIRTYHVSKSLREGQREWIMAVGVHYQKLKPDTFFWQWLLMNVPHRSPLDRETPWNSKVSSSIKWFAAVCWHRPERWGSRQRPTGPKAMIHGKTRFSITTGADLPKKLARLCCPGFANTVWRAPSTNGIACESTAEGTTWQSCTKPFPKTCSSGNGW